MLVVLVAQAAGSPSAGDLAWLSYLGPFLPFGGGAVWLVIYLLRANAAKDARIQELTEKVLPLIAEATLTLREAVRELDRRDR